REGKALDRGPDGVETNDRDVEVGVADARTTRQTSELKRRPEGAADDAADAADRCLGKRAVLQRAIGTVDRARPERAPVVGIATPEAPSLHRFKTAIHQAIGGIAAGEYGIINSGKSEALVSTKWIAAA